MITMLLRHSDDRQIRLLRRKEEQDPRKHCLDRLPPDGCDEKEFSDFMSGIIVGNGTLYDQEKVHIWNRDRHQPSPR